MCLAIPARIVKTKEDNIVEVSIMGVSRDVSIDLTPDAKEGDYVLIHAGFAIEVVDPQFAQDSLDLIRQMPELVDLEGIV